jgi:hypothetical protein
MARFRKTQGSKIEVSGIASPSVFAQVVNVTDISDSGVTVDQIDTTNLDSTAKEYVPGLPDFGTVTVQINWDSDETTHQTLDTIAQAGPSAVRDWRITESGGGSPGTRTQFKGFIQSLNKTRAVNNIVKATVTIKKTGFDNII